MVRHEYIQLATASSFMTLKLVKMGAYVLGRTRRVNANSSRFYPSIGNNKTWICTQIISFIFKGTKVICISFLLKNSQFVCEV